MTSVNKWIGIGNLTKDPVTRHTQDGKPITSFSIACNETWKTKDGERKQKAEFVDIVIFSEGLCRVAGQYLRKGSKCYVSGKLVTRKWQDKNTGADRYSTEVVLQGYSAELVLLGASSGAQNAGQSDYDDAPAAARTGGNYANKDLARTTDPNDPSDPGNYGLDGDRVPF